MTRPTSAIRWDDPAYEDYEVIEASSGPEGIALAEREAPDLVFLDIKMPGMDGLEVLQQLRAANDECRS